MQERKALGKGLSSLIPLGGRFQESASKVYFECPISDIMASPNQPRKLFDKSAIDELAASIEEKGILQPLVVRSLGGGKYEIIAGERRFRAAQSLGLSQVPVIVKEADNQETLELALIENLQRQDLNPVEEALAFKELLSKYQYTQDELAKRIGKDRSSIANTLRLLKLSDGIRAYIISGQISMGHARALLAIDNSDIQKKVADRIIQDQLSVRDIEDLVRKFKEGENFDSTSLSDNNSDETVTASTISVVPESTHSSLSVLEDDLKKHFKTKVKIKSSGNSGKGKIVINYHSTEDLNRIVQLLKANQIVG